MNLSLMDFLFYVPFFCTAAAAAVTEIVTVVNKQCLIRSHCYIFTVGGGA
jgi:hypothetical protein